MGVSVSHSLHSVIIVGMKPVEGPSPNEASTSVEAALRFAPGFKAAPWLALQRWTPARARGHCLEPCFPSVTQLREPSLLLEPQHLVIFSLTFGFMLGHMYIIFES